MVQKRQSEVIPYNDCLYRNLGRFMFIVLLDIDEMIVPVESNKWFTMSASLVKSPASSYCFPNVYFMDDMVIDTSVEQVPSYFHMMRHLRRSATFSKPGFYSKCFHTVGDVLTLHNHLPLSCLNDRCKYRNVNQTVGQLQHYRKDCVKELKKVCNEKYRNESVFDKTIWKYRDQVMERTNMVLKQLGFFRDT